MATLILFAVLLSPILVGGAWIVFDLIRHIQKP